MPELDQIANEDAETELVLVIAKGSITKSIKFVESKNIEALLLDGRTKTLFEKFKISGVPLTLILDREGRVRQRLQGKHKKKVFHNYLNAIN